MNTKSCVSCARGSIADTNYETILQIAKQYQAINILLSKCQAEPNPTNIAPQDFLCSSTILVTLV